MSSMLLWALWLTAGGQVNGGGEFGLKQTYVAAYFETVEECDRVLKIMVDNKLAREARCIQARYVISGSSQQK